jgi:diguanylate cyclase
MIDIDHFKSFNDRFGHVTGDSVLRLIGAALKQSIKGQDIAARYGGEEFAVILPNTDLRGAVAVAEQVRHKIASGELKRRSDGQCLGAITVSIGVATHQRGERFRMMIEYADACLYEAKRAGRNCTRCEDGEAGMQGDSILRRLSR